MKYIINLPYYNKCILMSAVSVYNISERRIHTMPKKELTKKEKDIMNANKTIYNRETYRIYTCRLNKKTDKDILDMIYSQPNSTDYIRQLIQADLNKQNKKKGKK